MNIFGLHITTVKAHKQKRREQQEWNTATSKSFLRLHMDTLNDAVKSQIEYVKQNKLWNRVISKLLWENHNLRMAK
ncbi:hypothetical protein LCGC14_0358650 [marine sediment metagenome]|uniref:Uncharacterized protein n=1 Tax=marine sediment metagenome TaxID=412755 RepID=A0A0F9T8P3_9ZZZZ